MWERQNKGDYDAVSKGGTFANTLTDRLRAVSHYKHLRVSFNPQALLSRSPAPSDSRAGSADADADGTIQAFAARGPRPFIPPLFLEGL
jgi:hypothetical protein